MVNGLEKYFCYHFARESSGCHRRSRGIDRVRRWCPVLSECGFPGRHVARGCPHRTPGERDNGRHTASGSAESDSRAGAALRQASPGGETRRCHGSGTGSGQNWKPAGRE
jgi:hypothetical protein